MNEYGLIGYPLEHSFSKKYFTKKFEREGLDARYTLFPIKDIYGLNHIISGNPDLKGLNVTIPYKQLVLTRLDSRSNIPDGLSACNCIKIINGKLHGYNTDAIGFELSLFPYILSHHTKALILGNGGAAAAVKYIFQKNNIGYTVVSRKINDGSSLTYAELDKHIISDHTIIINTTPLGMFPFTDACPDIPYTALTNKHLLYDMVYNPGITLFLKKGAGQGAAVLNGYEMLVIQAEESWRIWNEK